MAQHSNWICPQCGRQDISGDLIQCPSCGKKRNRWGYWDCESCRTKSIRADHKECPNCGRPRARNVKFYLRDDLVEFVDEVSGQDAVRIRRANWICSYCRQQNDDSVDVCVYCSASREESTERYHDVAPPEQPAPQQNQQPKKKQQPSQKRKRSFLRDNWLGCLILSLIFIGPFIAAGVVIAFENLSTKKIRTADSFHAYWKCDIYVEECRTFNDSNWEMPEYGRLLDTRVEDYTYVDHYERRSRQVWVDDDDNDYGGGGGGGGYDGGGGGWEDYGDGQFGVFSFPKVMLGAAQMPAPAMFRYKTEYYDEPVYKTIPRDKYYYEYDAWVYDRTVTTKGGMDSEPYFDELTLEENERESERTTRYLLDFTSFKNEAVTLSVPEEVYRKLKDVSELTYRRDISGDNSYDPQFIIVLDGVEYSTVKTEAELIPDTVKPVYENGDAYLHPERVPAPFVFPE